MPAPTLTVSPTTSFAVPNHPNQKAKNTAFILLLLDCRSGNRSTIEAQVVIKCAYKHLSATIAKKRCAFAPNVQTRIESTDKRAVYPDVTKEQESCSD